MKCYQLIVIIIVKGNPFEREICDKEMKRHFADVFFVNCFETQDGALLKKGYVKTVRCLEIDSNIK